MSEYVVKKSFYDMTKRKGFRVGEVFEETDQEKVENLKADGFLEDKETSEHNQPKDNKKTEKEQKTDENNKKTDDNDQNLPEWPKHTGGGWYELSNGEKVQGKEEALEAQAQLGE